MIQGRGLWKGVLLAVVLALLVPGVALAAPVLLGTVGAGYGEGGDQELPGSTLVELDPVTGALVRTIGRVGYIVNGLEYDSTTGILYASTSLNDPSYTGLITIDMATGAGTPVAASSGWGQGDTYVVVTNITADSSGQFYGWTESWPADGNYDDLVRIDKVTGVATWVGESGVGTSQNGLDFDGSDVLFMVNSSGPVYTVNPVTGAATSVGFLGTTAHHGDFHPDTGEWYGIQDTSSSPRSLVVADLSALTYTTLPSIDALHTLTFLPEDGVLELTCPGPLTVECAASVTLVVGVYEDNGAEVDLALLVDDELVDVHTVAAGTAPTDTTVSFTYVFEEVGLHTVRVEGVSDSEATAACETQVTVEDTTPPAVTVTAGRPLLWPPRWGLLPVLFSFAVTDACDDDPYVRIKVYSDEAGGSGPFATDVVMDASGMRLRAERAFPGDGRAYLIVVEATDRCCAENTGYGCVSVVVPAWPTFSWLTNVRTQASTAEAVVKAPGYGGTAPSGFVLLYDSGAAPLQPE